MYTARHLCLTTLVLGSLVTAAAAQSAPQGDPKAGAQAFSGGAAFCMLCHGGQGQGGLGPDLAGTGLTFAEFKRAVHRPWGIMPAFPNLDDQTLADMLAFLAARPKVDAPAPARTVVPPEAPLGQRLAASYGCGQCHGAEAADPRRDLGGFGNVDLAFFTRILTGSRPTYEKAQGRKVNRMGIYDRGRIPEPIVREIFDWLTKETGLRVPMTAEVEASAPADGAITYTLTIDNEGEAGRGLAAEDVTVSLVLPAGAQVRRTTGSGYAGVRADAATSGQAAVWKLPRIAAGAKPQMSVTLAGTSVPKDAFKGSAIRWSRPAQKRPANQTVIDARIPDPPGDWISTAGASQRPSGQVLPLIVTPAPSAP